jgi:hypothetical protein
MLPAMGRARSNRSYSKRLLVISKPKVLLIHRKRLDGLLQPYRGYSEGFPTRDIGVQVQRTIFNQLGSNRDRWRPSATQMKALLELAQRRLVVTGNDMPCVIEADDARSNCRAGNLRGVELDARS